MSTNDIEQLVEKAFDPRWQNEELVKRSQMDVVDAPHAEEVFLRLKALGEAWGFRVNVKPIEKSRPDSLGTQGRTNHFLGEIEIAPADFYRQSVVLAHELAHAAKGPMPMFLMPVLEPLNETYAETVAFLVATTLGWPTETMASYLGFGMGKPEHQGELRKYTQIVSKSALKVAERLVREANLEPFVLAQAA